MGCGFITKITLTTKAQTNKTTPQFVIAPLPVAMATATAICILLLLHLVRVHVSQNVHHSMRTATRPTPTQFPSMQMTTHAQRQMKTAVIGHDATVASCLNLLLHRSPWPWQQPLPFPAITTPMAMGRLHVPCQTKHVHHSTHAAQLNRRRQFYATHPCIRRHMPKGTWRQQ